MAKPRSALILGGGLTGLTCADELTKTGVQVTLLEKQPVLGGLARNVLFDGGCFDLGGHRFFTGDRRMIDWLFELLGDRLLEVPRKSRIRLAGRYFDYPLRPFNALFGFGARRSARILADYLRAAWRRRLGGGTDLSLEDWVRGRFGRAMYELYFRPYSEKVWGLPCSQISGEWAAQRIQLLNLGDAVRRALLPAGRPNTYASCFWYPRGGIGVIARTLADRVRERGGDIRTGREVTAVKRRDKRIEAVIAGDESWSADVVISTLPLTDLARMLDTPPDRVAPLSYRALRCVFLTIDAPGVSDDSWLYFPEADVRFSRCHEPRNWDPGMAPPQKTSLCLEFHCGEGDAIWNLDPRRLAALCRDDLERLGLVAAGRIAGAHCENVSHAYPVFRVGFREQLAAVHEWLAAFDNLYPVGRTGAYRYENMDQVAAAAIALVRRLVL